MEEKSCERGPKVRSRHSSPGTGRKESNEGMQSVRQKGTFSNHMNSIGNVVMQGGSKCRQNSGQRNCTFVKHMPALGHCVWTG